MRPSRSRRVQAQRKFAQGAYVPPNAVAVAAANDNRRDVAQDARNVTINHMSPSGLLDVVSMQGIHTHFLPIVLVERMRGGTSSPHDTRQQSTQRCQKPENMPVHKSVPSKIQRKRREYKRVHVMSLRSRRRDYAILEGNRLELSKNAKRKVQAVPQKSPKPKKICVAPSEFSLDDNRPLTYFAKCSTPKKSPAPVVQKVDTIAEPVAGPSGLQRNEGEVPSIRSSISSIRGSYYNSEYNIHRWMNDSITPDSRRNDEPEEAEMVVLENDMPVPCLAKQWRSVQDVINAPKHELDSRCNQCRPCQRIAKLMKLSSLLQTQVKFDLTGSEPLPQRSSPNHDDDALTTAENDHGHLYLELLPKHPSIMMKLRIHMVLGKEILSACLIPRGDARINKEEFLLDEQEHLLDQLIKTLLLSLNDKNKDRRLTISSFLSEESDYVFLDPTIEARKQVKRQKQAAAAARLKDTAEMQAIIKAEKEAEVSRIEAEKEAEVSRIEAEKKAEVSRIEAEKRAELARLEEERKAEIARLEADVRARIRAEVEAELRMMVEVDQQAKALEAEKDAKCVDMGASSKDYRDNAAGGSSSQPSEGGKLSEAPVYRPTEEEFNDPIKYFEKIWPEASNFGICKIVPPDGWKPATKIFDDLRFNVTNQYISRLFSRWGPATRELCAIRLCLQQQKIQFARAPLLEGVEVNLGKLYHVVQRNGGLENVINRNKWGKVAEEMKLIKSQATERRLDQIYVKYLLSYDTLAHHERQDIMRLVEKAWHKKNQKLLDRALNPLHHQKRMLGISSESEDESEDENTVAALKEAEDCITLGASMDRARFKKIATSYYDNMIGCRSDGEPPSLAQIEEQYWGHVVLGSEHLCVHSAAVDTGDEGHGFTKNKSEPYGRHPWNLKMFSQHPQNMLRYLGPVLGVTVPTLHLGMLYSTSCWHKDPHWLPWIEYGHTGPSRIWYGIPSHQTDNFRKAVETLCPTFCQNKGLWLSSDIAMIPPAILRQHNVSLTRTTQAEGEFILAFPNAYTCCISTGYTESESVYFAPPSWLENLPFVFMEARESCEPTMFSIEQLVYLMAKDQRLELSLLKVIQPIYEKMRCDEISNRQILQERGLKFITETAKSTSRRKKRDTTWDTTNHAECEFCRMTLFLSKVKGLTSKNSTLCLEHTLKLLDTNSNKNRNVAQVEVYVNVTVKELNTVGDDMKRRLGAPAS